MSEEKKVETVPLDDMMNKDEKEANEKSPLKENAEDGEGQVNGKEKEMEVKGEAETSKTKLILVAILALFIICVFLITVFITVYLGGKETHRDPVKRYLRLIPTPDTEKNTITFRSGHGIEGNGYRGKVEEMKRFLEVYKEEKITNESYKYTICINKGKHMVPKEGHVCFWNPTEIKTLCPPEADFGYPEGKPCVFLAFDYVTDVEFGGPMDDSEVDNSTMSKISKEAYKKKTYRPYVYIECTPNSKLDEEVMGKIRYAPNTQEFPVGYFPYTGHPQYLPPFLAIKFSNPQRDIAIGITCRMYSNKTADYSDQSPTVIPFNLRFS